jgi:hypothetical protein
MEKPLTDAEKRYAPGAAARDQPAVKCPLDKVLCEIAALLTSLPAGEHDIRVRVILEDTWRTLFYLEDVADA